MIPKPLKVNSVSAKFLTVNITEYTIKHKTYLCTMKSMAFKHHVNISIIVGLLHRYFFLAFQDIGIYLPADNETYRCGEFTVACSKFETKSQYTIKKLSIKHTNKVTKRR